MKRRKFLQTSSAMTLPFMVNGMPVSAITNSPLFNTINEENDKILILVQLQGGNDGLNTMIPLDQYAKLAEVRSNIIVPESSLLDVGMDNAFHPAAEGFKNLYGDGKLNVVQSVGYPGQNRSHFRSTDIWTTASAADEYKSTGWMGRYFNLNHESFPEGYPNAQYPDPLALTVGYIVSETCQGPLSNFSMAVNDPSGLEELSEFPDEPLPMDCYGDQLGFIRNAIKQTNAYSEVLGDAYELGSNATDKYGDDNRFAQQLKTVARLISGGLKTKIYVVELGGWDTHANQVQNGEPTQGEHAVLLKALTDGICAFQEDMDAQGLGDKVMGMTFSEFGRRIRSNESLGTDHGTAAPLFVFGNCVNPTILGSNPEIPDEVGVGDGVPMQYDFRSVYGSILMDWFDVAESDIYEILYEDFSYIPIVAGCAVDTEDEPEVEADIVLFPNPCTNYIRVKLETERVHMRISLFDSLGHELKVISNKRFEQGTHSIQTETRELAPGNYYMRCVWDGGQKTKLFTKV